MRKSGEPEFLLELVQDRTARRNGHRERQWQTRVGPIDLLIPKLRQGTYYPSFLEPRKASEKALVAVVQEAYLHGVSTAKWTVSCRRWG